MNANREHRSGPQRLPLDVDSILALDKALITAFRAIQEIRDSHPAAQSIKFPPLPAQFSESIVVAVADVLFGDGWSARFGGRLCDVVAEHRSGDRKTVEVKATGANAFQELKAKDLRADVLVWLRFGARYIKGSGAIEIVVLDNPGELIPTPRRLDVARFERIPGVTERLRTLTFDSLNQLLRESK